MRKVAIVTDLAKKDLSEYSGGFSWVTPEELSDESSINYMPSMHEIVIFIYGREAYDPIKDLNDRGLIHIGLRRFNFNTLAQIPYVTLARGVKLVTSYGTIQGKPDKSKIEFFLNNEFNKEIPRLAEFEVTSVLEFDRVLNKLLTSNPVGEYLGLDAETVGFPLTKGFKTLGFSIVGSNYGFYCDCRDEEDYHGPVYANFLRFIEENYQRLVVYNCNFEIRWLRHLFQKTFLFKDAWVLTVEDDTRRGLKPSAQYYLGVPSWDDDLEGEQSFFNRILDGCESRKSPDHRGWERCPSARTFFSRLKDPEYEYYRKGLITVMQDSIERWMVDHPDDDPEQVAKDVKFGYKERIDRYWGSPWGMSDPYTLGKYCIYDSYYTKLIWDLLKDEYPRANEPYHNNFYYGSLLESTGIPINREKLLVLQDYLNRVQINTSVFYLKFYKYCLEDTVGDYVNTLDLADSTKRLLIDYPEALEEVPDKVLKSLLKICSVEGRVDWEKYATYVTTPVARGVWELVRSDIVGDTLDIPRASRRHRKEWQSLGEEFDKVTDYSSILSQINMRNLRLAESDLMSFNHDVQELVDPLDAKACKLVCSYLEDPKIKNSAICVMDHPETLPCYDFMKKLYQKWDQVNDLFGGREYKSVRAYITKEDLSSWSKSYNIHQDIPPIILERLPLNLVSVEEVADLLRLRELTDELKLWDTVTIDGEIPEDLERAKRLANEVVQWSSPKRTYVVTVSILKKYGWLLGAADQFEDYRREYKPKEEDQEEAFRLIMNYVRDNRESMESRIKSFFYKAGDHGRKIDQSVSLTSLVDNFKLGRDCIRDYHRYDVHADTVLALEHDEDEVYKDWDNLEKFLILWDMGQSAIKQLNPYIEGDKGMIQNSFRLDETLSDHSEVIDYDHPGDRFMTHFKICGVSTKRTSGFFHTFSPGSDEYTPCEAPEGKLITYFDISQAEPRVAAFGAKDPQFMQDYLDGKDVYMMLARQYRPDLDDATLRVRFRTQCKQLLLGIHYGMSANTLSKRLEMPLKDTKEFMDAYFTRYSTTAAWRQRCMEYAKENGEVLTLFGDRLKCDKSRWGTQGFNYVLQNGAAVSLQSGFFNMVYAAIQLGFDVQPKSVIHDSNQNLLYVKDLLYISEIYRRFFREYERSVIGVDFGYDLELLKDYRDHTKFWFDIDESIITFTGNRRDIDYYVKYLSEIWDLEWISQETEVVTPVETDRIYNFSRNHQKRDHNYCMHPLIKNDSDLISGRKYKVYHDWEHDEMMNRINTSPLDSTTW